MIYSVLSPTTKVNELLRVRIYYGEGLLISLLSGSGKMLEEIQQASQFTEYLDSSSLTFIDYAELYAANNNSYKPEDFLSNPLLESLFLTTARISNLCRTG